MDISKDKLIALGILAILLAILGGVARLHPLMSRFLSTPAPQAAETPYGTVQSTTGSTVVISSRPPFLDHPLTYTLMLTASTTILRHVNKTPQEFQQELASFKAGQASTSPIGYAVVPATRSELMPGAVIEAPGAMRTGDAWTASQIIIDLAATSTAR